MRSMRSRSVLFLVVTGVSRVPFYFYIFTPDEEREKRGKRGGTASKTSVSSKSPKHSSGIGSFSLVQVGTPFDLVGSNMIRLELSRLDRAKYGELVPG